MMNTKLFFEFYTGRNFLVIKTNKKIYRIVLNGLNIKISSIKTGEGLVPVKLYSVDKNRLNLTIRKK